MSWFGFGKNDTKVYRERDLKAHIKSGLIRLNLRKNKAKAAVQKARRDIANLLTSGDDEKARIVAEQSIKDENLISALEELQAISEEVLARIGIITANKRLPMDLKEPICTLIWSSARIDIKEFGLIREQFALRFGANLDHEALCNIDNCVSELVMDLLSAVPPDETTVFTYLKNVAVEFHIEWGFQETLDIDDIEDASIADIYGFDIATEKSDNVEAGSFSVDDFPDIGTSGGSLIDFDSKTSEVQQVDSIPDDLDSFEKMFVSVPNSTTSTFGVPIVKSGVSSPVIQKVVSVPPSGKVQTITSDTPPTPTRSSVQKVTSKLAMSQELAQMSAEDLEAEFEQLFNCSLNEPELGSDLSGQGPVMSSISLRKEPEIPTTGINLQKENNIEESIPVKKEEFVVEHIATGGADEYEDLFSAPLEDSGNAERGSNMILEDVIDNQPKLVEQDYDDIFARLSAVTTNDTPQTSQTQEEIENAMTEEEWAARFNAPIVPLQPSTFDFSTQGQEEEPASPQNEPDDDDIFRRFRAL